MSFALPKTVSIDGEIWRIETDYRAILDICAAWGDPELSDQERTLVTLHIFYPDIAKMPPAHYEAAVKACFVFIQADETPQPAGKQPRLVDWEQDFAYIVAPINRVLGKEIRSVKYLHWWTFLAAYYEIGDCTFAQIVRLRDRKARGKPLDKQDKEWYRRNRHLVDLRSQYTQREQETVSQWLTPPKEV